MPFPTYENIRFIPIFHRRLEFAQVVRAALLAEPPAVVAVEFPGTWRQPILQAVNRLPFLSLILGESPESGLVLPVEPTDGGVEALRTARELGLAMELIDLDVDAYPLHREPIPDSHALTRLGYGAVMTQYLAHAAPLTGALDKQRETMMAHALQALAAQHETVTCVLGAAHLPGVLARLPTPQPRPMARAKPRELRLFNWSEESAREFLSEAPFLAAAYEQSRRRHGGAGGEPPTPVDRERESEALIAEAAQAYAENLLTEISRGTLNTMARFAKKYAWLDGLLVPDLYHLVTAARGVVDDDFGYEVWERGADYPWQDGSDMLPTIDIDETHAYFEGRRLTLHRKVRRYRPALSSFSERKRLRETHGGEWESSWSGRYICSHPPEDVVIEDYGRFLKDQAKALMSTGRSRVEPFTASIKDGIDVRETLRNWHQETLYVREDVPARGEVGSVAVIFDEDQGSRQGSFGDGDERYPWMVTWIGEHNQESDMAFYATPAGEQVVGPGISRCEYGGFVMSYPPRRMVDVWSDPFFLPARTKAEVLLLAALDYSTERNVLYVATRPPRSWFQTIAGRLGRRLIYLPLSQLSPDTLHKIRTFHVLDSHEVRAYAGDYIDL